MSAPVSAPVSAQARPAASSAARLSFGALLTRLFHRDALRRSRHRLAELDDHLLADIGLSRAAALAEAAAPQATAPRWDAPARWRS